MDEKTFEKRLKKKDYQALEKELILSYKKTKNPHDEYLLGICYSEQFEKREEASNIFRKLITTSFRHPNMYIFLANNTINPLESIKILQEGLKHFPEHKYLNNQLLFYLKEKEKIVLYEMLKKKQELTFYGAINVLSYYYKKKQYKIAYQMLKDFSAFPESKNYQKELYFLKILITYLNNKPLTQKNLNIYIISQPNTIEAFIFRLIDITLEKDLQRQKELIKELPYLSNFDLPFLEIMHFPDYTSSVFNLKEPLKNILTSLKETLQDTSSIQKINFIYHIALFYWKENLTKKKAQSLLHQTLEFNKDLYTENLSSLLFDLYLYLKDYSNYFALLVKELNFKNIDANVFNPYAFNKKELFLFSKEIQKNAHIEWNIESYQIILKRLIQKLFQEEEYFSILELIDHISYLKLNYLEFGFEIAYSLNIQNRKKEAKKLYEELLKSKQKSSAIANNLGILYEENQNYTKALSCFQKALDMQYNTLYEQNLHRCQKLRDAQTMQRKEESQALILLEQESLDFLYKLQLIYEQIPQNHTFTIKKEDLSILLHVSELEAQTIMVKMIENGYLFRKNNSYTRNILIEKYLKKQSFLFVNEYIQKIQSITLAELKELEYSNVLKYLHKIKDKTIKKIFIRDYHELIFAYLSGQAKSVILLSGSIIELLLLYLLKTKNITNYYLESKKKQKKTSEMDISELLEVCIQEQLLHKTPQSFVDGMKQFRNFIHPGKEIREKILEIDRISIELAFQMVNWLILTTKLN